MSDESRLADYLDRLAADLQSAREARHPVIAADYLAKVQRLSGWALREAVSGAIEDGMTWRGMAPHVQVPFGTLHRQYRGGGRIVVSDPGPPTEEAWEVPDDDPVPAGPDIFGLISGRRPVDQFVKHARP